jgi:hypothetical protein
VGNGEDERNNENAPEKTILVKVETIIDVYGQFWTQNNCSNYTTDDKTGTFFSDDLR